MKVARAVPPARRLPRAGLAAAFAAVLAACTPVVDGAGAPPTAPGPAPEAPEPSAASAAMGVRLTRVQDSLLAQGLLRRDGGGTDTPFTARMLAANFVRIALFDEYAQVGGNFVSRATPSRLRRWAAPVRLNLEFGASVPAETVAADRRVVAGLAARLARASRHPVGMAASADTANFHVLVLNEDERAAAEPRLRALLPGIGSAALRTITEMERDTFCLVFAFTSGPGATYTDAVAVVRAEHPDLMRAACYHEEIAQGLGLANDSPQARPSIFNDDEEFALLTRHDELLLRILYDPRLRPGMTVAEAQPIVEKIAEELVGGAV